MINFLTCLFHRLMSMFRPGATVTTSSDLAVLSIAIDPEELNSPFLQDRLWRALRDALLAHPHVVPCADQDGRSMELQKRIHADVLWKFPHPIFEIDRRRHKGALLHGLCRQMSRRHQEDRRFRKRLRDDGLVRHRVTTHHGPSNTVYACFGDELRLSSSRNATTGCYLTAVWRTKQDGADVLVEPLRSPGYDETQARAMPLDVAFVMDRVQPRLRIAGHPAAAAFCLSRWFTDDVRGVIEIDGPAGRVDGDEVCIACVPLATTDGRVAWRCDDLSSRSDVYLELSWIPDAACTDTDAVPIRRERVDGLAAPARRMPDLRPMEPPRSGKAMNGAAVALTGDAGGAGLRQRRIPTLSSEPVQPLQSGNETIVMPRRNARPSAPELAVVGLALHGFQERPDIECYELSLDSDGMPTTGPAVFEIAVFRMSDCVWYRRPPEEWRMLPMEGDVRQPEPLPRLRPSPEGMATPLLAMLMLPRPLCVPLPEVPVVLGHGATDSGSSTRPRIRFGLLDHGGRVWRDGAASALEALNLSKDHLELRIRDGELHLGLLGRAPVWQLDRDGATVVDQLGVPGGDRHLVVKEGELILAGPYVARYQTGAV